jgi:hypothetical protein
MVAARGPLTFIVRLSPGAGEELHGVVERVRTGEKQRFEGLERLGAILAQAFAHERGVVTTESTGAIQGNREDPPGPGEAEA